MSHASMLKARRKHQKTRKLIDGAAKQAKREAKIALAGPVVKKEKVKRVKVEKVKVETEKKVKKVKPTKEELSRQESKKSSASTGGKGKS
jgi:16S rRNA U1498 N3-methylase RsmE